MCNVKFVNKKIETWKDEKIVIGILKDTAKKSPKL